VLDAVERIEFIRAVAALQFGPQPGGALNFIMKMPRRDTQFHFTTINAFGSDGLFTDYTAIDGTIGVFGYYAYYDHRQRDGFREANSDYEVNNGSARLVYDVDSNSRFILTADLYNEGQASQRLNGVRMRLAPPRSIRRSQRHDALFVACADALRHAGYQKVFRIQAVSRPSWRISFRYSNRQRGVVLGSPQSNAARFCREH
jgi:hypothetical protein